MRKFVCKTFVLLFLFGFASAQSDSVYLLNTVELRNKSSREVIPSQKLSGSELERLNSHSVADALRFFAGVQIKDYGGVGGLKTINIRSMGTQHVGVFYDGIQLGNAQNGIVDLGRFSLDDLEMIELYNGQKSGIFQSAKDYGSSGAIYLETKKPKFEANKITNITARYKASNIQLINPSVRIEHKLSDKISLNLSNEFLKSDGEYKFRYQRKNMDGSIAYDTTAIRHDGDIETKRFELGLNGDFNRGSWSLKSYSFWSERGIPAPIVNGRFGGRGQKLKDENYFVQGSFHKKLGNKFETKFKAKFAYDYTHYTDTVSTIKVQNTYIQREIYISSSNLYSINQNWDISFAADFQYNNMNADLVNFSYPKRLTTLIAFATAYRHKKWKAQASILGTFVNDKVKYNAKPSDKSEYSPALFLSYKPFDSQDFSLRAFYKRTFRLPTFNDLYYTQIGNTNLKPEYTHQYNLGFSYNKNFNHSFMNFISLQADAYYNEVKDKIIAAPGTNMFRWIMMNLGKVEIRGIDASLKSSFRIGKIQINPLLTYTYQKAQDFTKGASYYADQIPYTPWHSGSAVVNSIYKTWNFNYSFIYIGERYDVNQNNNQYNYINPWWTHDLSVHKEFIFNKIKIKASVEVNNLLDKYYDVVINYPMPGRNYRFILSINL